MRLTPLAALLAACALTLTACGDDGDDPSSEEKSPSPSSESTEPAGKDKKKPKGGESSEPGNANPDGSVAVCEALDVKDVNQIVGGTLKKGVQGQGCLFADQSNPTATSIGLNESPLATSGGIDGAKTAVGSFVKGEPESLSDVGDEAFVVIGKGALTELAAGAAVVVDDSLVQLNVRPDARLSEAEIREQTIALLELVAGTF
jgi:hypothetical protein